MLPLPGGGLPALRTVGGSRGCLTKRLAGVCVVHPLTFKPSATKPIASFFPQLNSTQAMFCILFSLLNEILITTLGPVHTITPCLLTPHHSKEISLTAYCLETHINNAVPILIIFICVFYVVVIVISSVCLEFELNRITYLLL